MLWLIAMLACGNSEVKEEPGVCCSVADVQQMCDAELSTDLMLGTIRAAEERPVLTAQDTITLNKAGCSDAVIAALRGEQAGGEEEAEQMTDEPASASASQKETPRLSMSVIQGAKFIDVKNNSNNRYTNVTLTINGQYTYRVTYIASFDTDSMRKGSFKDKNGTHFNGNMSQIYITADQGVFGQTF